MILIAVIALVFSLYEYFDSRSWQQINCVERINIVFEERNKKYGAYSLRRDYDDVVLFIILGVIAAFCAFALVSSGFRYTKEEAMIIPVEYDTTLLTLEAPPIEEIETIQSPYKIRGGGGSAGSPSNDDYDPTPQETVKASESTKQNSKEHTSKGHVTTGKENNKPTTREKSPFGGTGGKNGDKGTGLFGNDDGPGSGKGNGHGDQNGNGGNVARTTVRLPNFDNIDANESCKVGVNLKIDANGNVISASCNRANTTTEDQALINTVLKLVKAEMKYSKSPGAPVWNKTEVFKIQAH